MNIKRQFFSYKAGLI